MEYLGRTGNPTWNRTRIFAIEVLQSSSLCSVKDDLEARCVAGMVLHIPKLGVAGVVGVVICYQFKKSLALLELVWAFS
jgi:hypothetical protein